MGKNSRRKRRAHPHQLQDPQSPHPPRPLEATTESPPAFHVWLPMLLFVIGVTFFPTIHHDFVNWDDRANLHQNPYLDPVSVSNTLRFWREPYEGMYIPVTYTAWALGAHLSQGRSTEPRPEVAFDSRVFHSLNVVLHCFSALVVFALLRFLLVADAHHVRTRAVLAAGLGACVFAIHPMQVEPVAWVTGLKDLLSGFLALIAVWQYLIWANSTTSSPTIPLPRQMIHYGVSLLAFGLALLSKPSAVAAIAMAAVLDWGWLRRPASRVAWSLGIWALIALPVIHVTRQPQTAILIFNPPMFTRCLIAGDALAFYLWKLIWPLRLGFDYGRTPQWVLEQTWGQLTWIIPGVVLGGLVWLKQRRVWLTASGLFVAGLLPVLGFIPFTFQNTSTVADRYLYLAMLGPAFALAWVLVHWSWQRSATICSAVAIGLLTVCSMIQVSYWQNSEALFQHGLTINPRSFMAHNNLGTLALGEGRLDDAMRGFRKAIALQPLFADAHYNLGNVLVRREQWEEAATEFRAVVKLQPHDAQAHNKLGGILMKLGRRNEAITQFREALRLQPNFLAARTNLDHAVHRR